MSEVKGSPFLLRAGRSLRHDKHERRDAMRKQLAIWAVTALWVAPFAALAESETMMPSDDHVQPGIMNDSEAATEEVAGSETIKALIVEIEGDRLIAETDNGERVVFLAEGAVPDLTVGDELELRLDDQANTAVILNVLPQNEEPAS
jgi:hypothetical protein